MNNSITKFKKNSQIIAKIAKAGKILFLIMALVVFAASLFVGFGGNYQQFGGEIIMGNLQILDMANVTRGQVLNIFLSVALYLVGVFLLFHMLHKLFSSMGQEESPFTQKVSKQIQQLSYLLTGLAVGKIVVESLMEKFITGKLAISLDLGLLLGAFIVYSLAQLFDYGCQLQKQADETL